jgi:signal transduction histidine kinase
MVSEYRNANGLRMWALDSPRRVYSGGVAAWRRGGVAAWRRGGVAPWRRGSGGSIMLHDFVTANRAEIIARCRARVASRLAPRPTDVELEHGVPLFLDQLVNTLQLRLQLNPAIGDSATKHGNELLAGGFTIAQVVRDYGDICQTITDLAVEKAEPITAVEFRTLNLCLDDAIAGAVTEYGRLREHEGTERFGRLVHELRNLLNSGLLAFGVLKTGSVGIGGSTGAVLARSLAGLARLIDRELAEVRLGAGVNNRETVVVREFIEDVEVAAMMDANARGVAFSVVSVANDVTIHADRQILTSVVANLLQNAFKFTRSGGHVTLRVHATADRVLIDVEDECGGLPPGKADELFRPFEQRGSDRTGLGLGLGICDRGVRMNGGELHVLNRAGTGCVFTVALPRLPPPVA